MRSVANPIGLCDGAERAAGPQAERLREAELIRCQITKLTRVSWSLAYEALVAAFCHAADCTAVQLRAAAAARCARRGARTSARLFEAMRLPGLPPSWLQGLPACGCPSLTQ
jgi:hypothetical protein